MTTQQLQPRALRERVPEPWATAMLEAGLEHRGEPSMRALARACREIDGTQHPSTEAVRLAILGKRSNGVSDGLALLMARALGVSPQTVGDWISRPTLGEQWLPPRESARLTQAQRRLLEALIRNMVGTDQPADDVAVATPAALEPAQSQAEPVAPAAGTPVVVASSEGDRRVLEGWLPGHAPAGD